MNLTPREREVVGLVAQGLTTQQIAGVLGSSFSTVKTQIQNAMNKTGARNRTVLAVLVATEARS